MAQVGRPETEINWEEFDKLCELQCTQLEIASWFNCTDDTINNRVKKEFGVNFSEYYSQKAAKGKISLRRKQWQACESGSVPMLIWLGKQYLGQTDKQESQDESKVDELNISFDVKEQKSEITITNAKP